MNQSGKASVLIVDDRPEKVLALEALLSDLNLNIVRAYSGKEALRNLLQQDFAVILLDVNMPAMDGFETAELIRQRRSSEHIPIIFITALGDEMHVARGYSLGAVDYILQPVVPEVLRTKVSVFVELYRKTEEVKQHAAMARQRVNQLHKLTAASLSINSALSMEQMLHVVSQTAREVIGAEQAATIALLDGNALERAKWAVSVTDRLDLWRYRNIKDEAAELFLWICRMNQPVRISVSELPRHGSWRSNAADLPLQGLLAAPLTGRDGRNLGLIEVSWKQGDAFTQDDEAILVQLAQMASIALENTLYCAEREANRIKDEFLATLSHELRTPLNAILGWTQLLRLGKVDPKDAAHGLEVIERNVKSQSKLIEDLLDVSRITSGKLAMNAQLLDPAPVVQAAVDAIRPVAERKQIEIELSLLASGVQVHGDPDRLQQVVWNLLANATKFTPGGGRISVRLTQVRSHARIQVSDTGSGISPDFLPHVFDRFRQADSTSTRSHGGLGIGLAIVRHIVELHDGRVHAESPGKGQGSTFTVDLPLAGEVSPQRETEPSLAAAACPGEPGAADADLSGIHVLVVDDEPDAREVIAEILSRAGAMVTSAASAPQALELLMRCRPHVLVSDIAMPDQDGYDLMRLVRELPAEQGGGLPAIALTAHARNEDALRALSCGFQMHIAKPAEPASLVAAVAHLAGAQPPAETMLAAKRS